MSAASTLDASAPTTSPGGRAPGEPRRWASWAGALVPVAHGARRAPLRDAVLYGLGAGIAAVASVTTQNAIHHAAAVDALPVYVVGALLALALTVVAGRLRARALLGLRVLLAVGVLVGAGLVPQLGLVAARSDDLTGHHTHAETAVIEEGARTILAGEDPYDATFDAPGIGYWSLPIRQHFPYLPAMLLLGLPRVLLDDAPVADARVVFVVATVVTLVTAFVLWRAPGDRRLLVFQWLLVLPTGTLTMIGGGHDLPVLALLFLALVLLHRRNLIAAALVLGVAAAMRHNAWVLVPFVVLAAGSPRERLRVGAVIVATALAVTAPFAARNPAAFVEDVVRWPLDLGKAATNAQAPTLGGLIVDQFPTGRPVVVVGLLVAVVATAALLTWRYPPRTAAAAALAAGLTTLALVLFAPSGRIGYLVYPIALLVWSAALLSPISTRRPTRNPVRAPQPTHPTHPT